MRTRAKADSLKVACPRCHAGYGEQCFYWSGHGRWAIKMTYNRRIHVSRGRAARGN